MSAFKKGTKKLKKGYRYAKGGRVVKVKKKADQGGLFGTVIKSKRRYTKGSKSNTAADRKRTALQPGKRRSKSGRVYFEYRKNRSDVNGRRK